MSIERPLTGCIVGISISESEDMERLGFDRSEIGRCVVRLSESLLAAGARIAFGHDWRPSGVMEAVAALAVRYVNVHRDAEGRPTRNEAPILNRVAPPDIPFLWQQREEMRLAERTANPMVRLLEGVVDARQTDAPPGTSRSEALTLMRRELASLCHVRVCLGGRLSGFSGRMPGILEEAFETLSLNRPVLTSAIFGGASSVLLQAVRQTDVPYPPTPLISAFLNELGSIGEPVDFSFEPLDENEEKRLWYTTSVEQCIELILRGAVRWWAQARNK